MIPWNVFSDDHLEEDEFWVEHREKIENILKDYLNSKYMYFT